VLAGALDLTRRINEEFTYDAAATTLTTPVEQDFAGRRGVSQDFSHLQIACLRSLGIPARFVSGFLLTHPPEGKERLIGAVASHAWLAVWCPGHGWVDLDPTNNLVVSVEHITAAWGRDYSDVSPIKGAIFGGGAHTIDVAVDVIPAASALGVR
jgi:transglutaminase-like putative cysteine protease